MTVTETAKKWYSLLSFPAEFDLPFARLLEEAEGTPPCPFSEFDLGEAAAEPGRALVMFLYFCEELSRRYEAAGIPESVLLATLEELPEKAKRHCDTTGAPGLSGLRWIAPTMRMEQFRLGRLVFCMAGMPVDIPQKGLQKGDPVVDVHVPAGASLTPESCADAFAQAEALFDKYFPDYSYRYFTCFSWLLDGVLRDFLKEDSNILQFAKLFEPVYAREMDSILHFMFKYGLRDREELRACPASSDFARRVKEYALSGGVFHNVLGIRPRSKEVLP